MAEGEIVNTLGFNVSEALDALRRLDAALQATGRAFGTFGDALDTFNGRAAAALKTMRSLATAAGSLSTAMSNMPTGAAAPAATPAAQAASPSFWLPPGMAEETQRLNAALASAGNAGADAGSKIANGMKPAADKLDDAKKKAEKFTISWQTLGRIVMTQMIVRAMSQIRDALHEAVDASLDFQQSVAEIRTIAPQIGGTFTSLSSEAAEFAKRFNIPLAQSTEGLYQTISNQFAGVSQRANVMAAAVKLARVGVMDFQSAIMLLTGTLNAYGMADSQADAAASKFFTTIRLGRVRGKELADTMGQVMPIASELGVNLDELNSAMVAMTIGGMDAHKTVTGLRGAMTGFLKPSEDMKKVLRELGFASAEQLIQAKGFQGALQAVADASGGMASEIAKSFRNVRALTAELRLTGEGAKQVESAMRAMEASTPEALDQVFKQFTSTDAERLTSQINQLKITLTQDFGSAITRALGSMMQLIGGADRVSSALQALAFGAAPLVAALGVLGTAFMTFGYTLGPVGWTLMGITAALSLFVGGKTYLTAQSINETRRLAQVEHEATIQYIKDKEEELRKLREVEEKKMEEENRSWANRSATIRRDYFKSLDELREKNKTIIESNRQAMQSMVAAQDRVVSAYRNAANAALRIVQESQNRRTTLEAQADDQRFKEQQRVLKLSTEQEALSVLRRAWDLEKVANETLAKAQSEDDVRRAAAIQQRAKAYLDEGTTLAGQTKNTWLQYQAERSVLSNLEAQIKAEKQLETLQAARAQTLADEAAKEQRRLDEMKTLMKAILKDLDAFDKQGARTPRELAEQQKRLTQNVAEFREKWLGGKKADLADLLAFDQLQRRVTMAIEGGVSEAEVKELYSAPETFSKFREDIEKGVGPVRLMIEWMRIGSPGIWEATEGMSAEETEQYISQRAQNAAETIKKYQELGHSLEVANGTLERSRREALAAADRWVSVGWVKDVRDLGGMWERFTGHVANTPVVKQAREELVRAIAPFTKPGAPISTRELEQFQRAYELYLSVLKPSEASKEALDAFQRAAEQAAEKAGDVQAKLLGMEAMRSGVEEAKALRPSYENALKAAEEAARKAKESAGEMRTSAQASGQALTQVSQIDMSGLVGQAQRLADAMWDAASASWSVQAPAMTAAHGGKAWSFLAAGGRPQGTDVIPAMLSPGEVVVNAASARKFAAQLTAINAGIQPVFRSEGGSVTNIGDINLTVNGGEGMKLDSKTARSFATMIRRELRRGTATL